MYTRNKIALMIENKLGYTNGWKVDDETYERECLMIADEIIQLFSIPVVVGQSEQLKRDTFIKSREETARAREASAIKQTLEIYCAHDELPTVNEVLERIGRKH